MARLRFRRIPLNELSDLSDVDLRLLDHALCDLRDKVAKEKATFEPYVLESLKILHDLVLKICAGESVDDDENEE